MAKSKKKTKKKNKQNNQGIKVSEKMAGILRKASFVRVLSSYVVIILAVVIIISSGYVKKNPESGFANYFNFFVPLQQLMLAVMVFSLIPAMNLKYKNTKSKKDLAIMCFLLFTAVFLIFVSVLTITGLYKIK